MRTRVLLFALSCTFLSCQRDLGLPIPQRGLIHGSIDTSGRAPLNDQTVTLVKPTGARDTAVTSATGEFTFDDLAPGQYTLKLDLVGFAPLVEPVVVTSGAQAEVPALKPLFIGSDGTIRGRLVPPTGVTSIAGASVELRRPGVTESAARTAVGFDGTYVVRLPEGDYDLTATHPAFTNAVMSGVRVLSGSSQTLADLQLGLEPSTISGTVLLEVDGNTPAAGPGTVIVVEPGGTPQLADPSTGAFTVGGLAQGDYRVRVERPGYNQSGGPLAIVVGRAVNVDAGVITLGLDRGSIEGTVQMGDGLPAAGVQVTVTGVSYSAIASPSATDQAIGTFRITGIPVGTNYELVARKEGYLPSAQGAVSVRAGETTRIPNPLQLSVSQGQFQIDDGNSFTTPDFTGTRDVTVNLSNAPGALRIRVSEDPSFADAGFGSFSGAPVPFRLGDADGLHQVYAQWEDNMNVRSMTLQAGVLLDRLPPSNPTLSIEGGVSFTRSTLLLAVSTSATEGSVTGPPSAGLSHMRISGSSAVDGQGNLMAPLTPWVRDTVFTRSTMAQGPQSISVQLVDRAGNVSAVQTQTIVIDNVPPAGSIAIRNGERAEPGFTDSTTVVLDLTALPEPNGGFVQMKLANSQLGLTNAPLQPFVSPVSWPLASSTEGNQTVFMRLVDAAGNTSGDLQGSIVLDRTPPTPATATLVGSAVTNASSVTLTLATTTAELSPDAGVTVSESLLFPPTGSQGPMLFPGNSQVVWPVSGVDGPRVIYVRFRDRAGNDTVREVRFTRDTEAPTGSLTVRGTLGDLTPSNDATAVAMISASLTAAGATEYALITSGTTCPSTGYQPMPTSAVSLSLPAPGTFTVGLCLRDAAQNTGGPFFAAPITYDTSPPTSCAISVSGTKVDGTAAPSGKTGRRVVTVSIPSAGCSEAPVQMALTTSAVTCTNTGAFAWVPWAPTSSFFLPGSDGLTDVRGCVRDRAGNVGTLTPTTITLDTTPPQAPAVSIAAGAAFLNLASGLSPQVTGTASGTPTEWAVVEGPAVPTTFSTAYGTPITLTFSGPALTRTVNALFRDDVGNVSAVASDDVTIDQSPPTGTMTITTPTGNAFTNSVSVEVTLSSVSNDVRDLFLVRGGAGACAAGDFSGATATPFTSTTTFLLAAGDGLKRVCGKVRDAAGNESTLFDRTVTLDTLAPTEPRITTQAQVRNLPNGAPFTVATSGATTEANFARYEGNGGSLNTWTTLSTMQATTSFDFTLVSNANPAGLPNTLRLRAVDLAGNLSPESSVVITTDVVAPGSVTLSPFAIDNRDDESRIFWAPPSAPDLAGFRVYYGRNPSGWAETPHTYNGSFATQGASPFFVPVGTNSSPLSGITNGTLAYATVRAVDRAGNESPFPTFPSAEEVTLQPNVISPSIIADLSLAPMASVKKIIVVGDRALVLGLECNSTTFLADKFRVTEVALGGLFAPFQSGTFGTGAGPTIVGTQTFTAAANMSCLDPADLLVQGPWVFVGAGATVSVHRLAGGSLLPTAANQLATWTAPIGTIAAMAVNGSRLFVTTRGSGGSLSAFDLASLYDQSGGTTLTPFGSTVQNGSLDTPGGLVSVRERLITTQTNTFALGDWSSSGAWPTPLAGPTLFATRSMPGTSGAQPAHSGNLIYVPNAGQLSIHPVLPTFNTTALSTTTVGEAKGVDLLGDLFWTAEFDTRSVRVVDLSAALVSTPSVGAQVSTFQPAGLSLSSLESPFATASWGPYRLVGTGSTTVSTARLLVLEVANPSALQVKQRFGTRGGHAELVGGFLVTSQQSVVDLHSGPNPLDRGNYSSGTGFQCSPGEYDIGVDSVLVDDQLVVAHGTSLGFVNFQAPLERVGSATRAQSYDVPAPGPMGSRIAAVERYGNFLLAVEDRAANGVWLEVFDLSLVLDHDQTAGTQLTAGSSRGSVRLGTYVNSGSPGAQVIADLELARGRAVVGIDQAAPNDPDPSPGVFIVDLAAAFDDSASSTTLTVVDTIPAKGVRSLEVNGNYVWLAAQGSFGLGRLEAWPIAGALTTPPTALTATTPTGLVPFADPLDSVIAKGGWAFVSTAVNTNNAPGIYAYDVSVPSAPRPVGFIGERSANTSCVGSVSGINQLTSAGHRLYFTSPTGTSVIQLE